MRTVAAIVTAVVLSTSTIFAVEPVDYASQFKPLLAQKCFACHGALKQESGLRLDAASLIREGGDSGAVIEPGDTDASALLQRVSSEDADERMSPESEGSPLNEKQLDVLRAWIDQGAPAPDEPIPPHPRKHWAYQPPIQPEIPRVKRADWAHNPLDRFISAQHVALPPYLRRRPRP